MPAVPREGKADPGEPAVWWARGADPGEPGLYHNPSVPATQLMGGHPTRHQHPACGVGTTTAKDTPDNQVFAVPVQTQETIEADADDEMFLKSSHTLN